MKDVDLRLDRLLRSAALGKEDVLVTAPFGFDTRVVARWRAGASNGNGLSRLIGRVALLAALVIIIATAGALREVTRGRDLGEPLTNEFAIADSVIENEFWQ
jgi:hypothetical protein